MTVGKVNTPLDKVSRPIHWLSECLCWVSMVLMALMMLFVAVDVMGRYFFNKPFKGSSDLIELMMGIAVFFGMAYCTRMRGDARVDVLYTKLPHRFQAGFDCVTLSAGLVVYVLIAWRLSLRALGYLRDPMTSPVTDLLNIPYWPFLFLAALGCTILCFELLLFIIASFNQLIFPNRSE